MLRSLVGSEMCIRDRYKLLPPLQRLCVVRCLRPDRLTMATELFIVEKMGKRYVQDVSSSLKDVIGETDTSMPVYYILTPGGGCGGGGGECGPEGRRHGERRQVRRHFTWRGERCRCGSRGGPDV
eukprot:TRINITY_DN41425_c0_g1_i1.p1 TRINITY_DN41425_c0_g1~~TRINITY_DN41425_c0_g1_i1.p1  ORF type:complete len:140 (+),score=28.30 TRINITY_DN41425_c0_g1_i1:46-420(+)